MPGLIGQSPASMSAHFATIETFVSSSRVCLPVVIPTFARLSA